MNCKNCGTQFDDGARSCPTCGAERAGETTAAQSEPQTFVDVSSSTESKSAETKEKAKSFAKKQLNDYKNFKSLSTKSKVIHFAVPLVCVILLFNIFGGAFTNYKNDEELAKSCAVAQIQRQVFAKDETVYDVKVVDSDGCGRFIVTATTKDGAFETWWVVIVQLNKDGETYNALANYHGDGITADQWVQKYKTESDYDWGVEQ